MLKAVVRALRSLNDWRLWGAGLVTVIGIAAVESHHMWSPPGGQGRAVVKLAIYWGMWLLWPAALLFVLRVDRPCPARQPACVRSASVLMLVVSRRPHLGALHRAEPAARRRDPCLQRLRRARGAGGGPARRPVRAARPARAPGAAAQRPGCRRGAGGRRLDLRARPRPARRAGAAAGDPPQDLRRSSATTTRLRPAPTCASPCSTLLAEMRIESVHGRRVALGRCELVGLGRPARRRDGTRPEDTGGREVADAQPGPAGDPDPRSRMPSCTCRPATPPRCWPRTPTAGRSTCPGSPMRCWPAWATGASRRGSTSGPT